VGSTRKQPAAQASPNVQPNRAIELLQSILGILVRSGNTRELIPWSRFVRVSRLSAEQPPLPPGLAGNNLI